MSWLIAYHFPQHTRKITMIANLTVSLCRLNFVSVSTGHRVLWAMQNSPWIISLEFCRSVPQFLWVSDSKSAWSFPQTCLNILKGLLHALSMYCFRESKLVRGLITSVSFLTAQEPARRYSGIFITSFAIQMRSFWRVSKHYPLNRTCILFFSSDVNTYHCLAIPKTYWSYRLFMNIKLSQSSFSIIST